MRQAQGYLVIATPEGRPQEWDTISCGHCSAIVRVKPGTGNTVYIFSRPDGGVVEEPGAFCRVCMRAVCLTCCDRGICSPVEKTLARMEGRRK